MIKVYEILFFLLFIIVSIYSNINRNINIISGCTDTIAINYNPEANIDDNSCDYMENNNCTNVPDPCLCMRKNKELSDGLISCESISNISLRDAPMDLQSILSIDASNDVKFHNLINTAYDEYFYSKLMEISQLSYMHYYQTDGIVTESNNVNARLNPQYLFYIAIENIKLNKLNIASVYLKKFLELPEDYFNNLDYYKFDGCCEWDLDWVKDNKHRSFKIANATLSLVNNIKGQTYNSDDIISLFNELKKYDSTKNTIDLIDVIIFNFLFNMNLDQNLILYKNNLLDQFTRIQMTNLKDPFENIIGNYTLSTQIDMLIMMKIIKSKEYIISLKNNNAKKSYDDAIVISKYDFLIKKYFSEIKFNLSEHIDVELNTITTKINNLNLKKDNSANSLSFLNDKNSTPSNKTLKWEKMLTKTNNMINSSEYKKDKFDETEFKHHHLINLISYDNYTESVDRVSSMQYYPLIKQTSINKIENLIENKKYKTENKDNSYQYKDDLTNKEMTIKTNFMNSLNLYYYTLNLFSKGSIDNIKEDLLLNNENNPLAYGYKILLNSYSNWGIILNK